MCEHHDQQRVVLVQGADPPNGGILATLRDRELETVAKTTSAETGLSHHPVTEGQRVADV